MDINVQVIPVDIILPSHWYQRPKYTLKEPLHYKDYTVPTTFISDGATVPRLLLWLFPAVNRYFLATVLHDYLLSIGVGWQSANNTFKSALLDSGISIDVIGVFMASVRAYAFIRVNLYKDKR